MTHLEALELKTRKFIQELNAQKAPPIYKLPVGEARKVLDSLQSKHFDHLEKPAVLIEDMEIPGGSHHPISLRIFRPHHSTGKLPVIMYFHGGGWILGNKHTHDRLVREICNGAHAAVVFVNYTPSPEARYPVAIEEAYIATKYIAENGAKMHLDAHRLAVCGDSAGGNMATVVALLCKDRQGPKICRQVLFYPVTDAGMNTPSYEQFADGPWLTRMAMEWFWNAYEPSLKERKKPTVSPLQAKLEQLKGMPPALIITDENDVLRDEGEAYATKLMQAGVDVIAIRCIGTHHDFVMLNALSNTPAARNAIELANTILHKDFAHKKVKLSGAA